MATTPMCKHCRTRPATKGVYCAACLLEVVHDVLDGNIMAGCEQGFIDMADFQFSFGEATDPLTEEDEKGSAKS